MHCHCSGARKLIVLGANITQYQRQYLNSPVDDITILTVGEVSSVLPLLYSLTQNMLNYLVEKTWHFQYLWILLLLSSQMNWRKSILFNYFSVCLVDSSKKTIYNIYIDSKDKFLNKMPWSNFWCTKIYFITTLKVKATTLQ